MILLATLLLLFLGLLSFLLSFRWRKSEWKGAEELLGGYAVVTGANSGVGLALCQMLLRRGAAVVMACRDTKRALLAKEHLLQNGAQAEKITIERLDLLDFSSVIECTNAIRDKYPRVDVLVANAGALETVERTSDGVEGILQANYLGHFLLCEGLRKTGVPIGRFVFVSSLAQKWATTLDLDRSLPSNMLSYGRAKLAEVCYARVLAAQGLTAFSAHPGVVNTNILAGTRLAFFSRYLQPLMAFFMKTAEEGAQTPLMLALASTHTLPNGAYFSECQPDSVNSLASPQACQAVYDRSIEIVKPFLDSLAL